MNNFFESGVVKRQRNMLVKNYQIIPNVEDKKLIELNEGIDDDVLNIHMGMVTLLKNNRKHRIDDTKDNSLYIGCGFISGLVTRGEN